MSERPVDFFGGTDAPAPVNLAQLHARIGQLALGNDFLESALTTAGSLKQNHMWHAVDRQYRSRPSVYVYRIH